MFIALSQQFSFAKNDLFPEISNLSTTIIFERSDVIFNETTLKYKRE